MHNVASVRLSGKDDLPGSRDPGSDMIGLAFPHQIVLSSDDQCVRANLSELLVADVRLPDHQTNKRTSAEKVKNPHSMKTQSAKSLRLRIGTARNQRGNPVRPRRCHQSDDASVGKADQRNISEVQLLQKLDHILRHVPVMELADPMAFSVQKIGFVFREGWL